MIAVDENDDEMFYQTERSQDGQPLDVGKSQFNKTQDNYDDVEAIPAIL